jgi:hypothetical protein
LVFDRSVAGRACFFDKQAEALRAREQTMSKFVPRPTLLVAVICGVFTLVSADYALAQDTNILFVGNSYTHGRYQPVLGYNAGPGNASGDSLVHDLLCPSLPCTGAEAGPQVTPTTSNTPGGTLTNQLNYLQANSGSQYNEVGPYAGVAGIFLQFTKDAGLHYNVSLIAVSSATLTGYANNTGSEAGDLSLIENSKYNDVVLQDQSFQPLPTTITVNGQTVPTRGNPTSFQSGVSKLVNDIDKADTAAHKPDAAITLFETPPIASYGYTSSNPNAPIFGSSTVAQQSGNKAYAPYVGDANPIAAMASDLHNAYVNEAANFDASNPTLSHLDVALAGDAWVTAINSGLAQLNPFLSSEPAGRVDLWDSNPLLACCETPIGYHPSQYGDYLDALVLFGEITGLNPETLSAEWNLVNPMYSASASLALGINPQIADGLAIVAEDTLLADGPTATPLPGTWSMMVLGFAGIAFLSHRRSRRSQVARGIVLSGHAA